MKPAARMMTPNLTPLQQRQQRFKEGLEKQAQERKTARDSDLQCYDLLQNLHEIVDPEFNPNFSYFNTLSSFKNNLQVLSGTDDEPLIGEISDKLNVIIKCLAKDINKELTKQISHGGSTRHNKRNKNKKQKTKRRNKH
jgi:hypothetical protein